MRPVNKGDSPYETIADYHDALPYLGDRIGLYCSYCGMSIVHMPEVEHGISKSTGGAVTDWKNLLLACKYCNTRKASKTTPDNKKSYLWPDEDNTELAYRYVGGIPSVNQQKLMALDPSGEENQRAKNLFDLVKLGKCTKSWK